jgi:hypothetical protein
MEAEALSEKSSQKAWEREKKAFDVASAREADGG